MPAEGSGAGRRLRTPRCARGAPAPLPAAPPAGARGLRGGAERSGAGRSGAPRRHKEGRRGESRSADLTCCFPGSEAGAPGPSAPRAARHRGRRPPAAPRRFPRAAAAAVAGPRRTYRTRGATPCRSLRPRSCPSARTAALPAARCRAEEEPPAAPARRGARPERGDAPAAPPLLSRSCPAGATAAVPAGGELARPLPRRSQQKAAGIFAGSRYSPNALFCFHSYSFISVGAINTHLAARF